jgi:phosphoribosylglycinamide formyltransferase-1
MKRYVILISGRGSNMESLLDAGLPGVCAAVISNKPEAAGLALAAARGMATVAIDHRGFATREDSMPRWPPRSSATRRTWSAGRLHAHPRRRFVRRFEGRLLNIHPSLLPAFPRRQDPRPGAGRRGAGAWLHGAFRHAGARRRADRRPGGGTGAGRRR